MTGRHIYTVAGTGTGFDGYSGDGGPATSAELSIPQGVAVDGAGNMVIADTDNNRVRVAAAATGTFYGVAMTAGNIYTVAGNGVGRYAGDGGPGTSAELNAPDQAAVDGAGNLLIADTTTMRSASWPASTGTFYGQAMTAGRHLHRGRHRPDGLQRRRRPRHQRRTQSAADRAGGCRREPGDHRLQQPAGPGGRGSTGTFYGRAMTAGDIYTVAGNGQAGYSGNRGPAAKARIYEPYGVALDAAGNLVLTDNQNNRVRVVAEHRARSTGRR